MKISCFFSLIFIFSTLLYARNPQVVLSAGQTFDDLSRPLPSSSKWQISTGSGWQETAFPALRFDSDKLSLRVAFKWNAERDSLGLIIRGGALAGNCTFYLNKKPLHFQPDHGGPLFIRIPNAALLKNNLLQLDFSSTSSVKRGFPRYNRLYTENRALGMYYPLVLAAVQDRLVSQLSVQAKIQGQTARVTYNCRMNLPESKLKYRVDVVVPQAKIHITKFIKSNKKTFSGSFNIPKDLMWSDNRPEALQLNLEVTDARQVKNVFRYGLRLREISFRERQLFINSQPVAIRGINYHRDPARFVGGNYRKLLAVDLTRIRKAGFNALRLPHYLPDSHLLQLADSLGLLVFGELPIVRYPSPIFFEDAFLETGKQSIQSTALLAKQHPSLVALGLAHEINVTGAAEQKFMIILKDDVRRQMNVLSYVSPIPAMPLPLEDIADFYLFDIYRPLQAFSLKQLGEPRRFFLAGKIGCVLNTNAEQWDTEPGSQERNLFFKREFDALFNQLQLKGGFVESYMDWSQSQIDKNSIQEEKPRRISSGLLTTKRLEKHWLFDFNPLWQQQTVKTLNSKPTSPRRNFYSLLVIFGSVVFFAVYRRRKRMTENMRKAMRHPYGFFVDLRERRIIPLFNSIWVGSYAALLLAVIFSGLIYHYRNDYMVREISANLLGPLNLYKSFIELSSSPALLTLLIFIMLFLYPVLVSLFLKFFSLFGSGRIRYRQGLAIGFWSGVPILFLLPVSLLILQILAYQQYQSFLFILLGLIIFWAHLRIMNGIRVLLATRISKVLIVMLLSYMLPLLIFWAAFKPMAHWIDYIKLLFQARSLF